MNDSNKKLGLRICKIREQRKLTREKLGELSNISNKFIYDIETGQKGMPSETLYKLSIALNVYSDYLLFGIETNNEIIERVTGLLKKLNKENQESIEKNTNTNIWYGFKNQLNFSVIICFNIRFSNITMQGNSI